MGLSFDAALVISLVPFFMCFNAIELLIRVEASHYPLHDDEAQMLRSQSHPASARDPYRTAYHFHPRKNWMNDPNGPMIYKKLYHLFYQYNPKGPYFAKYIVWGHSTSPDLVNWTPQPPALKPSIPSDIGSCWSGSATLLPPNNKPAILYTGVDRTLYQVQNLAFPRNLSDPYLREWVKAPQNPVIRPYGDGVNATAFRDPGTAWLPPDGRWRLVIGTQESQRASATLYRSDDFVHWRKARARLYGERDVGMWECVDFYPVARRGLDTSAVGPGMKHVFKVSRDATKHDVYLIGRYDLGRDEFVPDHGGGSIHAESGFRYDYGLFYASKTFYDGARGRRVLWGWVNEVSSVRDNFNKGWAGIQAVPRTIVLDKNERQLILWPVEEIEKLRENEVRLPTKVIKGGSAIRVVGIKASQADVDISFKVTRVEVEKLDTYSTNSSADAKRLCTRKSGGIGPFGILTLASRNLQEYTAVSFRIFKTHAHKPLVLMCSDQTRSSLNSNPNDNGGSKYYAAFVDVDPLREELSLRTLIDHSVVESFGAKGKTCITARVYPKLAIDKDAHLYVFNNGTQSVGITSFRGWSMRKARIN